MTKRIILDLMGQGLAGDKRRPSEVVRDFGFTYREVTGSSFFDAFIFEDCENIPADLPDWLSVRES
ncbi:hypothetical protein GGQ72_004382 [Rhizobium rhizoryzae]|uniref:Uncharacterized protein n=1 Tax=Rhizobium rhizoryzae TaxID=451876 RepID=A0A7W6LK16_9HYPH|nr:hypothetical protein [Rhizobium rhizoryzae]